MTLLDTATAAAALGVTERTIRRLIAEGHVKNRGTSRQIRVTLIELQQARSRRAVKKGLAAPESR